MLILRDFSLSRGEEYFCLVVFKDLAPCIMCFGCHLVSNKTKGSCVSGSFVMTS